MKIVNIPEAKTHLSRLIEEAAGARRSSSPRPENRWFARLPWHHRDPFDRLLVAQAREHGLRIATRDPLISPYGVPVLEV